MLAVLVVLCTSLASSLAVEFTFELPDRDRQCFHEEVKQGTRGTLEYQVNINLYLKSVSYKKTDCSEIGGLCILFNAHQTVFSTYIHVLCTQSLAYRSNA